jgi:molecular chaperone GrpE
MSEENKQNKEEDIVDSDEIIQEETIQETERETEECCAEETSDAVEALQKKCNEYLEMAQRTQASFQNYKKRTEFSVSEAYTNAKAETIGEFLAVLDNLERASQVKVESESDSALLKGVEMVIKQFNETMKKFEIEKIEALGEEFDPNFHHAVMQAEAEDDEQKNKIVEEFQTGYKLGDKIIRYSMVKVAQ